MEGGGGLPGPVRPTLGAVEVRRLPLLLGMPVAGRDERPRSSAWEPGLARAWDNRGWLKPPTPEEGFGMVGYDRALLEEAAHRDGSPSLGGVHGVCGFSRSPLLFGWLFW